MSVDWGKTIGAIAPTIATVLGGPLAGLAVSAIGKAFGMSDPTIDSVKDALTKGQLTGDQLLAMKQAENNLKTQLIELNIKEEQLYAADRDSARKRQVETKDGVNSVLAFIIVGAFIAMVGATLLGYAQVESVLAGTLVGYLSAKCEQVLAFYFGSTRGSGRKTELLAKSTMKE